MTRVCGTFGGYEGKKDHRFGVLTTSDGAEKKIFFQRRRSTMLKNTLGEITLLKGLEHPNIHRIIGIINEDSESGSSSCDIVGETFFVYSELAEFGSVERIIASSFGLPESAVKYIIVQVIPALQYLHEHHIIHRAVNARHILVSSDGHVRLNGFKHAICITDCSRWVGEEERVHDFDDSLQDVFVWLAPEIFKQDLNGYGVKSDVYSLGITICEISNGFAPFCEMEPLQILYEKIRGSTPFLLDSANSAINMEASSPSQTQAQEYHQSIQKPPFSKEINNFVAKCLTYNSADRPSCNQLLQHKFLKEFTEDDNGMRARQLLAETFLTNVSYLERSYN